MVFFARIQFVCSLYVGAHLKCTALSISCALAIYSFYKGRGESAFAR